MNLFERFEELSRIIDDMNAQAAMREIFLSSCCMTMCITAMSKPS